MRVTIKLDHDIHRIVKGIAEERCQSMGKVVSDLVRDALEIGKPSTGEVRNGFPLLKRKEPYRGYPVTNEEINRIRYGLDLNED